VTSSLTPRSKASSRFPAKYGPAAYTRGNRSRCSSSGTGSEAERTSAFRNPESWEGRAGLDEQATRRIGAMLLFQDVNPPQREASALGAQNA
jgi:hypothetical protein